MEYISKNKELKEVAIKDIAYGEGSTGFSFSVAPNDLASSLKEFGLFNPITLAQRRGSAPFVLICGYRRVDACFKLGLEKVPAFILNPGPKNKSEALLFNVMENRTHRVFNEIEISNILSKLKSFGFPEENIIEDIMPLLGLEKSKKIYADYLLLPMLSGELREYLVEIRAPLRVTARLARWKEEDRRALFNCIGGLKPGANKLRELMELLEEISLRDESSPGRILGNEGMDTLCHNRDLSPSDKLRGIHGSLEKKRNPLLSKKKELMEDELKGLDFPKGAELYYPKNFEGEDLTLSLKFSSTLDFISKIGEIKSKWQGEKIERILKILRH